ncbi:unnamed protein product [Larinioides sclopetarius]|uniref:Transposase n=1 Tax=Larinioides sclopetarius TaxID=280406 RepID=A0AAV2BEP2_9ARAC
MKSCNVIADAYNVIFTLRCQLSNGAFKSMQRFIPDAKNYRRKLFIVADALHVLKNLRSHLTQGQTIYLPSKVVEEQKLITNEVSVAHIKDVILLEEQNELKLCPQLTASCLYIGHYDKMKVGPPHVLLNNSVAVALRYYVNLKKLDESALATAWFIETVASNLKIGVQGVWKPVQAGIILTTTSMLALQEIYLKANKFKFVLLSRFSQDAIENLFSTVRLKNPVPNCKEFKTCLRLIILSQYFTSGVKGNSSNDNDEEMGTPILQLYSESKNSDTQEFSDERVINFDIGFEKSEIEICNSESDLVNITYAEKLCFDIDFNKTDIEMHTEIVEIALSDNLCSIRIAYLMWTRQNVTKKGLEETVFDELVDFVLADLRKLPLPFQLKSRILHNVKPVGKRLLRFLDLWRQKTQPRNYRENRLTGEMLFYCLIVNADGMINLRKRPRRKFSVVGCCSNTHHYSPSV